MKKLLIYLKDYKKESILAPLFKMLEASFELFVPLVMAEIIDKGIKGGNSGYIWQMGSVLIILGIVGLICSVTAQFFSAKAAVGFATKMRKALFDHIQKLSFSQMDEIGTSTLITRMTSDVNQAQNGVNMVLRLFLRSPFIVLGAMIMAFTVDVKSALIFVVTIPLLAIVVFGIMLICIPMYRRVQNALDKVLGKTRENLTGARVIRAFAREDAEKEEFYEDNQLLTAAQVFVGRISALMNPITYIIVNAAILILIWTGAWRVNGGAITQGQVVALVSYMSQILVELVKLANLIITVTKAVACGNRIQTVFEIPLSKREKAETKTEQAEQIAYPGNGKKEVVFDHVSFAYHEGAQNAISDISFTAKEGQTIGIIGGTGSGKSTIVNMIPGFYYPSSGSIFVDGKDTRFYPVERLREKIGIVMQRAVLFHGTIRENLKWGKEDAFDEELWKALETAQSADFVRQKDGGLDYNISQGGKNLSGGQKQRMTIARALVRNPEILILDDSASALDYATDAALRSAIRSLKSSPIVFIVSQRAASVMHADLILVLDEGEVVGMGSHQELLSTCQVYQEIYTSQFPKEGAV